MYDSYRRWWCFTLLEDDFGKQEIWHRITLN